MNQRLEGKSDSRIVKKPSLLNQSYKTFDIRYDKPSNSNHKRSIYILVAVKVRQQSDMSQFKVHFIDVNLSLMLPLRQWHSRRAVLQVFRFI